MGHGLDALSTALAGYGLTWLVQSWVLLALGLVAGRVLRRSGPAVQSGVYRTTLVAVLVSPVASAALAGAGFDGFSPRLSSRMSGAAAEPGVQAPQPPFVQHTAFDMPGRRESRMPAALPRTEAPGVTRPALAPPATPISLAAAATLGLAVWALGSTIMALRLGVGQARMHRLRASAVPAEPDAETLCREIAGGMGLHAPTVWRSPFLFSPCLDGFRRPAILLPDDVGENLRDTFVHELAHLARRDGAWNLLRRSAAALLWVQPLLWVLSRRIEETAEEVCDDFVVQFGADRARYAGHLLELAGRALPPVAPAGVGMVTLRSMLARRIVRILDTSRSISTRAGRRAIVAMLVAGLAGTVSAGLLGVESVERKAEAQTAPDDKTTDRAASEAKRNKDAPADVPITGRIVDLEGRPVAGASITVGGVLVPKSNDLTPWLSAVKKGEAPWIAGQLIEWNEKAPGTADREATTDKDGRFQLKGFGPDRVVTLKLQSDPIAYATIDVATRKMAPLPAPGFQNMHGAGTRTIFGSDFTYTAAPGRPIEGVVKDIETGRPLAGAEVRSYRFAGSDFIGTSDLRIKTDAQGRFRMTGLPKGKGNALIVVPNDDQPYFMQEFELRDSPGVAPLVVDTALRRGIWIEGRVTEEATGKPVAGAWLHYMPFLENPFAQAHAVFDKDGNTDGVGVQDRYQTKPDGTFRLVGLPGRAIVGAVVHGKPYLQGVGSETIKGANQAGHFETFRNPINASKLWPTVMKEINPSDDVNTVHVDFKVTTGPSVRFKVVDTGGKPVVGSKTQGRGGRGTYEGDAMPSAEGEVANLMPGEERTVLIHHEERKLGKVVRVRKGDDARGPVLVTLEPLAVMTGRVTDAGGNPVPGARVRPDVLPSGDFSMRLDEVGTDGKGRFRVANVPTGCAYALAVQSGTATKVQRFAFTKKDIAVKPGETTEVDEIRFKND